MFLKIRSILFPKWASGDNKKKNASPTRISCTQKRHPFSISQWESGKVLIFSIIPAPLAHLMRGVLCWPVVLAMVQGSVLHSISQIPLQFPVEFFPLFISFYLLFIFCFFEIVKIPFPAWICLLAIYKSCVPPRGGLFFRQRREHFVFCVFLLNLNATDVWLDPGFGRCHHVYGAMVVVRILCFARNKKANSNRLKCYGELLAQVTQMSKDGKASGTVWSGTCHSLLSMRAGFRLLYPPL